MLNYLKIRDGSLNENQLEQDRLSTTIVYIINYHL